MRKSCYSCLASLYYRPINDVIIYKRMKISDLIAAVMITGAICLASGPLFGGSDSNPKELRLADQAYEEQIRTILLYPAQGGNQGVLGSTTQLAHFDLRLTFDDLTDQRYNYNARIIHCNHDWTKSNLFDLDFLASYNEFPVNNFEYSVDTSIPYVQYWLDLPSVKLPGNYVVVVYRESDKEDIILSKRFMVYDNRITIAGENNQVIAGQVAAINQQINFTLNYKYVDIVNPLENIRVVIRQNQRWDNMATGLKPAFIRDFQHELEYRFFDDTKMFKGGNEFRFFDLRSINNPGRNVRRVERNTKPWQAYIERDKDRSHEAYSQYNDLNGNFLVANLDYRDASFTNYIWVNFTLASPTPVNGKVYVAGAFNYWNKDENNLMTYDASHQEYTTSVLLKQGWYDYQYLVDATDVVPYFFEGSHFQTENEYEILVYYRPFKPSADLLIGYVRLTKNAR
jgi:hypothetical protein